MCGFSGSKSQMMGAGLGPVAVTRYQKLKNNECSETMNFPYNYVAECIFQRQRFFFPLRRHYLA